MAVLISVFFLFSISIDGFFFGFSKSSKEGNKKFELLTKGLTCLFIERDFFIVFGETSFSKRLFKFSSFENLSVYAKKIKILVIILKIRLKINLIFVVLILKEKKRNIIFIKAITNRRYVLYSKSLKK